uniref:Membrane progestin receptor beta-like n=1 Tax=Phallusia mammillata TaxID=59560 RepID=A0A6F9DNU4_9ASCI|nr:membrane progestin receptor beta-like [Phallusia mammillata]
MDEQSNNLTSYRNTSRRQLFQTVFDHVESKTDKPAECESTIKLLKILNYFKECVFNLFLHENSCNTSQNANNVDSKNFYHALENSWHNVPQCCTEPYILKGYPLTNMPWRYYIKLLWIPNNEMLNIWTHLIPFFYFIWMLLNFNQELDLVKTWPLFLVTICAIILMGCSSFAHMFHSRSCFYHRSWFLIDYIGITAFAFGSTVTHFFACAEVSYYNSFGWYNLVILTLICCAGYLCFTISKVGKVTVDKARSLKLWSNGLGYFHGLLPLFNRFYISEDPVIYYHKVHILCMLFAPIWYAADIPQKYWPGRFDIVGHSHQIFHVFGALACYFDIQAVYSDVTRPNGHWAALETQGDYPSLQLIGTFSFLLLTFCFCLFRYCLKFIPPLGECQRSNQCICASFCSFNITELLQDSKSKIDQENTKLL